MHQAWIQSKTDSSVLLDVIKHENLPEQPAHYRLGSAGTNIVEAFLKDKKTAELLESDITRLSLLAIDIADSEIRSLQESHEKTN